MNHYAFKDESGDWIEIAPGRPFLIWNATLTHELTELFDPFAEHQVEGAVIEHRSPKSFPPNWLENSSPEEREEHGVFAIVETDPPELVGLRLAGEALVDQAGVPTRAWVTEELTLEELRLARHADRKAARDAIIDTGFPWTFGGDDETLQARDVDKANWLAFKDSCNDAIDEGLGAQQSPLPIRVTSNRNYFVTFDEGAAIMRAMRTWYSTLMGADWQLAAAIDAAQDAGALASIDLVGGLGGAT